MAWAATLVVDKRLQVAGALALAGAAAGLLYGVDPAGSGLFPPCPFHWLTGFYCPGCGTLRALHQLLHGHVGAAFGYNPLAMLALPFLIYAIASEGMRMLGWRGLPRFFLSHRWINALLAVIIAYWVLRNVPVEPFVWLAP